MDSTLFVQLQFLWKLVVVTRAKFPCLHSSSPTEFFAIFLDESFNNRLNDWSGHSIQCRIHSHTPKMSEPLHQFRKSDSSNDLRHEKRIGDKAMFVLQDKGGVSYSNKVRSEKNICDASDIIHYNFQTYLRAKLPTSPSNLTTSCKNGRMVRCPISSMTWKFVARRRLTNLGSGFSPGFTLIAF
mmetsp:Transcript_3256/g.7567  ORF Transcript_3256/g.7567 Transcript_3256/m.7567 type:complete len:184 (-) Transcript_3256:1908-2459(-)